MNRMFWVQAIIVMSVLLVSAPLLSQAAGPGTPAQAAVGPVLTSDNGTNWTCAYQPERATPGYYMGRAGQLERRSGYGDSGHVGRLVCTSPSGDKVRLFKNCQL
jgi:hypothetical protein